jgi:hypothetical protein
MALLFAEFVARRFCYAIRTRVCRPTRNRPRRRRRGLCLCYHHWRRFLRGMEDEEFEDDEIPLISGSGEGLMDESTARGAGSRRDEDIALDLMKFIAMTTGYGKTASSGGVGFTGGGSAAKPEEYAAHLLELYGKCLIAVEGGK